MFSWGRYSGDELPQLLFVWVKSLFLLHFWMTALPVEVVFLVISFFLSEFWIYHSTLSCLTRFLLRNLFIVSWESLCIRWVTSAIFIIQAWRLRGKGNYCLTGVKLQLCEWISSKDPLELIHSYHLCMCVLICFSCVWLFSIPRAPPHQAPLSMGFSWPVASSCQCMAKTIT